MPRERLSWFKGLERKGVLEEGSAQFNQPAADGMEKNRFLRIFGPKTTSRSPSPGPTSSALAETSPGQRGEPNSKPVEAPQYCDVATIATEALNQQDVSSGIPQKGLEEEIVAETGDQTKAEIAQAADVLEQQAVPHNACEKGGDNLWDKAYNKLPNELKQHLVLDKLQTLEDVLKTAIKAKEATMANRLKFKWGGKEINLQEKVDRLVGWIVKFKEVGDIAVQYNPAHAALPWAGVRLILQVGSKLPSRRSCNNTNLYPLDRCGRTRKISGSYCWNRAGCRVDWPVRHIRTVISYSRYSGRCKSGDRNSPQRVTYVIHSYIARIMSADQGIPE